MRAPVEPDVDMPREWTRLFPNLEYRWTMGLGPGHSAADFFADKDATGAGASTT